MRTNPRHVPARAFTIPAVVTLLISSLVTTNPAFARPAPKKTSPGASLERQFASQKKNVLQSIKFIRLQDGAVIYQFDPEKRVSPASVTKLVTAAVALGKFGPTYTFTTRIAHTGQRRGQAISGDLIAIGDGDPLLISEKMWQVAADLRAMGIREISGDIVVDNSLFDAETRDASREEGANASSNAYDAPVSAFAVNFNTVAVTVSPGEKPGSPGVVRTDPVDLDGIKVESSVKTGGPGSETKLAAARIGSEGQTPLLRVSGTIAADSEPKKIYRSMVNPGRLAGDYLRAFLQDAGISTRGRVRTGKASGDERVLLTVPSYDMRRIVSGLNTFSNNFIGDMLTKRFAAGSATPGSLERGAKVIRDYLKQEVGIRDGFVIENGSGLSTENRLSADDIVRLLAHMEKDMTVFPDFLASLPSYGWDGSLKRRMKGSDRDLIGGLIRAKSGTLSEPITVSTLAGYLKHPDEGLIAFAILVNGVSGKSQPSVSELRAQQDAALAALLKTRQN